MSAQTIWTNAECRQRRWSSTIHPIQLLLLLSLALCTPNAIAQRRNVGGGSSSSGGVIGGNYLSLPISPCPDLFRYLFDGSEWFGMLEMPYLATQQTIKLNVLLSVQAQLTSSFVGQLELYGSREAAQREIRQQRPVRYRVRFPTQSPLPSLKRIECNGRLMCSGRGEYGGYITEIRLEHSFYTDLPANIFNQRPRDNEPDTIYDPDGFNFPNVPAYQPVDQPVEEVTQPPPIFSRPFRPAQSQPQPRPTIPTTFVEPDIEDTFGQFEPAPAVPLPPSTTRRPNTTRRTTTTTTTTTTTEKPLEEECGKLSRRFGTTGLIVGGVTIPRGTWPWLAAVYINKATGLQFNCGGNLVSSRVVVTAAHCFRTPEKEYFASDVIIYLGRYNIMKWSEKGSYATEVEQIHVHSEYMKTDQSYDADLAVVIMAERVDFTDYIRPICLWDGPDTLSDIVGASGTIVGWGRDNIGNIVTPEPKKISVPVVSEAVCLRSSDTFRYITSRRTFCAGRRDGFGPCNGDSGSGMAMYKDNRIVLRGIVSAALADPVKNTCNLSEYVVFTDAAKFGDWIRSYF